MPKYDLPFSLRTKKLKYSLATMVLVLVVLYGVIPNLHAFGLNFRLTFPKHWFYLLFAVVSFYVTFIASSFSYSFLALYRLKRRQLALIQLASSSLSLMLPAGIGNISLNYLFLRNRHHDQAEAGLVIGINNLIGVLANLSLLVVLLIVFGANTRVVGVYSQSHSYLFLAALAVLALSLVTAWLFNTHIKKVMAIRSQILSALKHYRHRYGRIAKALACAAIQAAATAFAFWLCLSAYGIRLDYPIAFLIYSLSVIVGAAIPTPGGLGGVEASLTAGVVAAHGASASLAITAVLTYRLVSYWLPVLSGFVFLLAVERLQLIKWNKSL